MSTHHRFRRVVSGLSTGGYQVDNSVVLNDGDSQYLNKTFSTPTNSSQFGYSFWVKLGSGYADGYIISADGSGNNDNLYFESDGRITIQEGGAARLTTTQVLRDFHGWYNVVVSYDLGNASNDQKLRLYLNGSEVTSFGTDTRSSLSSTSSRLNASGKSHDIGANVNNGVSSHVNPFDGYLSQFVFLDGTVITPSMVGEFSDSGIWRPKDVTDSLSTNKSLSLVDRTSGTAIGDMTDSTAGNNLAAAFDGVFGGNDGANNATKRGSVSNAFVGKNWGTGVSKTITGFSTRDVNNAGYFDNTGEGRFLLYGSNSNPSSYNDGTLLYTGATFTSAGHTTTQPLDFLDTANFNTSTAYQYHWIALVPTSTASDVRMAELIFYEDGGSFGNNGFYLPFTNSAGLGQDYGGSSSTTVVQKNTYNAGSEINEGDSSANPSTGMKFVPPASGTVSKIELNASSRGFSGVTVRLETDSGSGTAPSGTLVTNGSVSGITSSGAGMKTATFSTPPEVTAGVTYWIVLRGDTGTWGWQQDVAGSGGALGLYQGALGYFSGRGMGHNVYMTGNHFEAVNSPTQTTDTPTNNHCVWSEVFPKRGGNWTLSEGNRKATYSSSTDCGCPGSIGVSGAGTWYFEITASSSYTLAGIVSSAAVHSSDLASTTSSNGFSDLGGVAYGYYANNGYKLGGPSNVHASYGATFANTDVIGVAFDAANGTLTFYKNGSTQGEAFTSIDTSETWFPFIHTWTNEPGVLLNNGQTAFAHTPPTGYVGINTANLLEASAPAIEDSSAYMQSTTYSGAAGANSINQSGNSKFKPDMVWVKRRDGAGDHGIFDSVRTTSSGEFIRPSQANGEGTESSWNNFDNDGFSFSAADTSLESNTNGRTYVGWQWLAGGAPTADNSAGAGATPTAGSVKIDGSNLGSALDGSIPAKRLSANTKAGFSIVKWTGDQTGGTAKTVAHGLGKKPNFIFIKNLDDSENWVVYNDDVGFNALPINTSLRRITTGASVYWADGSPPFSTSTFTVNSHNGVNGSGDELIAYCFTAIPGYSAIGKYVGNGSATDGPLIHTGFSPSWILVRAYDDTSDAAEGPIHDSVRDTFNPMDLELSVNRTGAEDANQGAAQGDFLSNGFKIGAGVGTSGGGMNISGVNYIYLAFGDAFAGSSPMTAR